ncbi:hypothetical protein HBI56_149980 [Parastagonospora nodorum]|nr:hypothetical protein HBH53_151240 [Parastagonospora nodorum]KAH3965062.1 hypothetical protein HBH51_156150 [Parastagonospora nodorum]KAH3995296.1 hypothetical protein HBI10_174250 [Parastagonospora nodorum]KAH4016040.1 hypothetical protein HBI13_152500 [Parastagonospora nodorum]KAH4017423.1 hypothetical protein HBI09_197120 [Parastagonospora nodorum]
MFVTGAIIYVTLTTYKHLVLRRIFSFCVSTFSHPDQSIRMDYFDDLDKEAMSAFYELDGDTTLYGGTKYAMALSSEISSLIRSSTNNKRPDQRSIRTQCNMDYLLKMDEPLTPAILASAAILLSQPRIIQGESDNGVAQFCQISGFDVPNIKRWLEKNYPAIAPVFAPINKAGKALSPFSACPTLGLDTTLPQHRTTSAVSFMHYPKQSQYPVWYFFYGTLANSSFLANLFSLAPGDVPALLPAYIQGGKLQTWGGMYKALVHNPGSHVDGWAYKVSFQEQEDALRMYETAKYEIVRVAIEVTGGSGTKRVQGCTFRFAGDETELD